mmetsp:Transcript_18217/g.59478  ORF Transcript_18217/g.59478 Transcript_18217/m.59478 type:complete len:124 (+) Transcript_18217:1-372(+)|eukprot:CAMPEP_0170134344 /NCGR_PEP_ID=MMETSP0033_2-20121228/1841_1 /TAXON_ID=195969 /ORGANISM="Dolichomastix tenuilepis, Strain CCMP3274" /LENGTH=123 /DNA_ID=CAMNT_0010369891 /DNA_START=1 /DNA_END=372 /DNA_ORIENTATION=+
MQSLARACREAILSRARVPVAQQALAPLALAPVRLFGANSYLDKSEVTERVIQVVRAFHKVDAAKVTPTSSFSKDLGLDSLDTVDVVMAFEEEFAVTIPDVEADKIASVEDAISYISSSPTAK